MLKEKSLSETGFFDSLVMHKKRNYITEILEERERKEVSG